MTREAKQPRRLPNREPVRQHDTFTYGDRMTRYRRRCGNTCTTGLRFEATVCVKRNEQKSAGA